MPNSRQGKNKSCVDLRTGYFLLADGQLQNPEKQKVLQVIPQTNSSQPNTTVISQPQIQKDINQKSKWVIRSQADFLSLSPGISRAPASPAFISPLSNCNMIQQKSDDEPYDLTVSGSVMVHDSIWTIYFTHLVSGKGEENIYKEEQKISIF